jgi:hypothetical protein
MSDARRLQSRFLSRRCDGPDSAQDTAVRAIRLVRDIRDRIEIAMRAPGDLITHTRQDDDSTLNDLGIIARLIRELAERL